MRARCRHLRARGGRAVAWPTGTSAQLQPMVLPAPSFLSIPAWLWLRVWSWDYGFMILGGRADTKQGDTSSHAHGCA